MRSAVLALAFVCAINAAANDADAIAISANIQARHFPFGTVVDPIYASASSDEITGYTRCGDSAIWTGHYLASEAFRYNVTLDGDALANVKKALAGLESLVNGTGTDLLARCIVPITSPFAAGIESEEASNGIHTNSSAGVVWFGNTSRDQYSGVMFGLAVAYDLVDDPGVQARASQLVTRLVDFLQAHAWTVVMPDGTPSTTFIIRPDQVLSLLQIAQHVNPAHFSGLWEQQRLTLTAEMLLPISLEATSNSSYFKFNLDYINLFNLVRLDTTGSGAYRQAFQVVRDHTDTHQNAFFNMIDRAINGPSSGRDAETIALLNQWLQRPRRDFSVDLRTALPVCGGEACSPVPVPLRAPTDFLWQRDPFQLTGGGSGRIESAGIDYILPYWMARYYGVLPQAWVQSAAGVSLAIAPGSIAAMYGSNLAPGTAQAASQPLPTTLGGTTLTVTDSAGVQRSAGLIYVSGRQINFIVPPETAPGIATFSTTSASATALVRSVAPSLFSMSGDGTGVAAATAVETYVADPSQQNSVPVFTCSDACTPVPIALGIDTPIYLTLYGTGFRNAGSGADVQVTINGVSVPVLYSGSQGQFAGLDQLNVPLPLTLRGAGTADVIVTINGQSANAVEISVQ